jgi:hypothetical protein
MCFVCLVICVAISKKFGSKTCRFLDKYLNRKCYMNRLASCASASVYSDVRSSRIQMSSLTPLFIEEPLHAHTHHVH